MCGPSAQGVARHVGRAQGQRLLPGPHPEPTAGQRRPAWPAACPCAVSGRTGRPTATVCRPSGHTARRHPLCAGPGLRAPGSGLRALGSGLRDPGPAGSAGRAALVPGTPGPAASRDCAAGAGAGPARHGFVVEALRAQRAARLPSRGAAQDKGVRQREPNLGADGAWLWPALTWARGPLTERSLRRPRGKSGERGRGPGTGSDFRK